MIRKMDLSPGEFHEMVVKWKIPGGDKSQLRGHYTNLRKQIFEHLDAAISHWFRRDGRTYALDPFRAVLPKERGKEIVKDKALLRRIWAPIDVLDDA